MQPPHPSYEDLAALVELQAKRIDEFAGEVQQLRAENEELRRRLGLNSSNSSRPPSSDGQYDKPKPKPSALRGRSGRNAGKQPGEPGVTRRQVATPDERRRVEPDACTGCGGGLGEAPVFGMQKRQVFEASAPPPPRVIEFLVVARVCPCCGIVSVGRAPAWATGLVQWGPGVAARGVLATLGHHLPYGRAALVLKQLSGLEVSTGFLVAARKRAAKRLEPFMDRVRQLRQTQ